MFNHKHVNELLNTKGDRIMSAEKITQIFKNESIHSEMLESVMLNYRMNDSKYKLAFYDIEVQKRRMGINGCKNFANKKFPQMQQKLEMQEQLLQKYEERIKEWELQSKK